MRETGTTAAGKAHLFFDCGAEILDQMKPIGDLLGLRCAFTDGLRMSHQTFARTATRAVAKQADNVHDPRGPARIRGSNRRQSISERLSLTFLLRAPPAAQQELHRHGLALDRQIPKAAVVRAMPISASLSAIRANADRWPGSGNNPTVIITERDTQNFDPWAGRPFCFRSHPPIAIPSLTANEPHKVRKTLQFASTPSPSAAVGWPRKMAIVLSGNSCRTA